MTRRPEAVLVETTAGIIREAGSVSTGFVRLQVHQFLGLVLATIALRSSSVKVPDAFRFPTGRHPADIFAFPKLSDPIVLSLSAVVSEGQNLAFATRLRPRPPLGWVPDLSESVVAPSAGRTWHHKS